MRTISSLFFLDNRLSRYHHSFTKRAWTNCTSASRSYDPWVYFQICLPIQNLHLHRSIFMLITRQRKHVTYNKATLSQKGSTCNYITSKWKNFIHAMCLSEKKCAYANASDSTWQSVFIYRKHCGCTIAAYFLFRLWRRRGTGKRLSMYKLPARISSRLSSHMQSRWSTCKTDNSHIRANNELSITGQTGFVLSVLEHGQNPHVSNPCSNCRTHAPLNNEFSVIGGGITR